MGTDEEAEQCGSDTSLTGGSTKELSANRGVDGKRMLLFAARRRNVAR